MANNILNNPLFTAPSKFNSPTLTANNSTNKSKRVGTTSLDKLLLEERTFVHGVEISEIPQTTRILDKYYPKSQKEWFCRLCNAEDGEETVLKFYPFKIIITYTQELEARKIYKDDINFDEDTMRLKKGKGSALYFRFENDAILTKLFMS